MYWNYTCMVQNMLEQTYPYFLNQHKQIFPNKTYVNYKVYNISYHTSTALNTFHVTTILKKQGTKSCDVTNMICGSLNSSGHPPNSPEYCLIVMYNNGISPNSHKLVPSS